MPIGTCIWPEIESKVNKNKKIKIKQGKGTEGQ